MQNFENISKKIFELDLDNLGNQTYLHLGFLFLFFQLGTVSLPISQILKVL